MAERLSQSCLLWRGCTVYQLSPHRWERPRTFIATFLNFKDQVKIMWLAREKGNIQVVNSHVAVFPDFSTEVQKKRSQFQDVKCCLRILHLKYSMLFTTRPDSEWSKTAGCSSFWTDWISVRGQPKSHTEYLLP